MVGEDDGDLAVEAFGFVLGNEVFEAVGFLGDEDGGAFAAAFGVEVDADLHVDFFAEVEEA